MEYNHEWFFLNKWCEFRNREVETEFREYEKKSSLGIVRLLMLFMGIVFALFLYSDYYFYGGGHDFYVSLGLRGAALVIALVVFFLVGRFNRYGHTLIMITVVQLLVFALYLINLHNLGGHEPALQFMSVMLFILAAFIIPNLWKNSLIISLSFWASYIIFCLFFLEPAQSPSLTQRGIYLGVCLVACAIFLYGRESSQRKHFAAEKLLEYVSITDKLTGIYNRGRFEQVLGLWIKNMRHDPFCLLLFDIDDFKKVNDTFGHIMGDQVLTGTAKVVAANIRDEDVFARWGGEEFVILFSVMDIHKAAELAERLRRAVEANHCGYAGSVSISIGVVQHQRGETLLDLVGRADAKMYEAKQAGKNRVVAEG